MSAGVLSLIDTIPSLTSGSVCIQKEEDISKDSVFEAIKYFLSNGGFVQTGGGTVLEDGTEVVLNEEEEGFLPHSVSVFLQFCL